MFYVPVTIHANQPINGQKVGTKMKRQIVLFALIAIAIGVISGCTKDAPDAPRAPLTAQQQMLLQQLKNVQRGDLIADPNGEVMGNATPYLSVRSPAYTNPKNHRQSCMLGQAFGMMTSSFFDLQDLARMNLRVIKMDDDEWTKVMKWLYTRDPFVQ